MEQRKKRNYHVKAGCFKLQRLGVHRYEFDPCSQVFTTGVCSCRGQHFLREIDAVVPPSLDVHVILDNLSTHKTPEIKRWLLRHPRFQLHFTPTHASWLNLVERFFGLLTEHALRRGSHKSGHELRAAIEAYLDAHNDEPKPFKWTKTADEILASIARFATRTTRTHPEPQVRVEITDPGD